MNPALGARCFLVISFAARMTAFPAEFAGVSTGVDAVATATPLTALKQGATVDVFKMFIGTTSGTIGETSVVAILIGAIYLVAKKIISLRIPVAFIVTTLVFVGLFGGHIGDIVQHIQAVNIGHIGKSRLCGQFLQNAPPERGPRVVIEILSPAIEGRDDEDLFARIAPGDLADHVAGPFTHFYLWPVQHVDA